MLIVFLHLIHQSRSRVLRFSAARTWVKITSVTAVVLFHGFCSLCKVTLPLTEPHGADGPIGVRVHHDFFGAPGRGKRFRESDVVNSASIFIIVFFIVSFIIHGAQEEARRNSSSFHLEGPLACSR